MSKPQSLYLDNQQKVIAYARIHHAHMSQCFNDLRVEGSDVIKIDRVYDYLREAFSLGNFHFRDGISGPDLLAQDNVDQIEKLLERFFIDFKRLPREQYLFYRLTINDDELADLIEFWIRTENRLYIDYDIPADEGEPEPNSDNKSTKKSNQGVGMTNDSNEFIGAEASIDKMIKGLLEEIRGKEAKLSEANNQIERLELEASINRLRQQVQTLQKTAKQSKQPKPVPQSHSQNGQTRQRSITSKSTSGQLRRANTRLLFEYYCKQNHITGLKATFDRIEHQSNTINYPKLIHMLKDFNLVDDKCKVNIFQLFQKAASDYKSLQYGEFEQLLTQLSRLLITDEDLSDVEKEDRFFNKLFADNMNTKLTFLKKAKHLGTGKAFNIRESHDFRIKPEEIKYNFQIIPHSGKTTDEIKEELVKRRENKEKYKLDVIKKKQAINQQFLKKLSAIDPYNSSLANLKEQPKQDVIVAVNNIQAFRDNSFNPKQFFKISQDTEDSTYMGQYALNSEVKRNRSRQYTNESHPSQPSPRKRSSSNYAKQSATGSDVGLPSPRKDRAIWIAEEVSHRAFELQKIENSRNEHLMKSIMLKAKPQTNKRRY